MPELSAFAPHPEVRAERASKDAPPKAGFICATVLAMRGLGPRNRERVWRAAEALAEAERNGQDCCHASEHRALLNPGAALTAASPRRKPGSIVYLGDGETLPADGAVTGSGLAAGAAP